MKMISGATGPPDLDNSTPYLFPLIHMLFPGFSIANHMFLNEDRGGTELPS